MLAKYFGDLRTQRDIHKSVLYKRRQSVQSTNSKTHLTTKQHGKFCQGPLKKLTEHSLKVHFLKLQLRRNLEKRTPEGPFWVYFLDHDLLWSQKKNQINVFLISRSQNLSCKVCIIRLNHICFEKSLSTFCQKYEEDFFKFCGLLRKPKLYPS